MHTHVIHTHARAGACGSSFSLSVVVMGASGDLAKKVGGR